jgi:hypothetical protein
MAGDGGRYGTFMPDPLSPHRVGAGIPKSVPVRSGSLCRKSQNTVARRIPVLDIAYLVIGAVFLGVCVLYALACDHL